MATPAQVTAVLNLLGGEMLSCPDDETRLRYGDYECPHCGADLEDHLRAFAQRLVEAAEAVTAHPDTSRNPGAPNPSSHHGVSDRRM